MFEKLKRDRCYIIVEIGGNFITFEEAVALINAAKTAGVDCVKLQTFKAETISSKGAFFDMESTGRISQYDYFKKYELSKEMHSRIFKYIDSLGMDWFSTPSHPEDVDMLMSLGVKAFKVGADDATNIPLLKYIARTRLPVFLSTGMCDMKEVKEAVAAIVSEGNSQLVIFHTISGYPTHAKDVNLNVLATFKKEFPDYFIGFSDHTLTTTACIAAATLGADVIERHFTLDKRADGPDHVISSTPEEMKFIVDTIREIEVLRGSSVKAPVGPELKNRENNRKSVVAVRNIRAGELISAENIYLKRPGTGIAPKHLEELFGKIAVRDIKTDELIQWKDIK